MASRMDGKVEHTVGGITFILDEKYEPDGQILGKGAYGAVISATNIDTGERVAIKRIAEMFGEKAGSLIDAKRVLRELKLMRHLGQRGQGRGCENVIKILDIMIIHPEDWEAYTEIYVVSELMPASLRGIVRSRQVLTDQHVQCFVAQILMGVAYIHAASVLHRDIKPENLVLDQDCNLKIIDFGLARHQMQGRLGYTEYVATRWYRAPEIVLQRGQYGPAADVWSIGCIMAELIIGRPAFPGENYLHQLELIFDIVGTPPHHANLGTQTAKYLSKYGTKPRRDFKKTFTGISDAACSILERMLNPDPTERPSCVELLADPYFDKFREDLPAVEAFTDFDFEADEITPELIRRLIVGEMLAFHPMPEHMDAPAANIGIPPELAASYDLTPRPTYMDSDDSDWVQVLNPATATPIPTAMEGTGTPGISAMETANRLTPTSANQDITLGMPSSPSEYVTP